MEVIFVLGSREGRSLHCFGVALAGSVALLSGCGAIGDSGTFVLYRNSVMSESARLHVATFDADDGEDYNRGNCAQAQALFQAQPGVKTRFWCEKGRFRK